MNWFVSHGESLVKKGNHLLDNLDDSYLRIGIDALISDMELFLYNYKHTKEVAIGDIEDRTLARYTVNKVKSVLQRLKSVA